MRSRETVAASLAGMRPDIAQAILDEERRIEAIGKTSEQPHTNHAVSNLSSRALLAGALTTGLGALAERALSASTGVPEVALAATKHLAAAALLAALSGSKASKDAPQQLPGIHKKSLQNLKDGTYDLNEVLELLTSKEAIVPLDVLNELSRKKESAPERRSEGETIYTRIVRDFNASREPATELLAAAPWLGMTDNVTTVEINTFGDQPRTAILYRDPDGRIVDWRWFTSKDQIPKAIGDGRYVAVWDDQGKPRTVYCTSVYCTRTLHDKELKERDRWPEHKRRKLSR